MKLDEVFKIRACYKTTKINKTVITRVSEEFNIESDKRVEDDEKVIDKNMTRIFNWNISITLLIMYYGQTGR